ncbi:type II toxin-antitoxin system HicB family antitoxin [Mesorhizobium muleiense]|uniref:type II toxin-antitoxin system HicB family antitoxin n=1 Tax=Mesorhizobium muleiense TaxID=1004279 RepID=UPI001F212871|nr:type II toxin-antitoxin system HicB family antitoxin [Mesorhizobium muleiense]MCF6112346.1 type II toxin-antitoxin system HicB family antitoxin [Mesorhizobium muleiense]
MSRSPRPSFHVRLPPELKARLEAVRGGKSLNREVVDRLERSFGEDLASQFGDVIAGYLAPLDDEDRAKVVNLASELAAILMAKPRKRAP